MGVPPWPWKPPRLEGLPIFGNTNLMRFLVGLLVGFEWELNGISIIIKWAKIMGLSKFKLELSGIQLDFMRFNEERSLIWWFSRIEVPPNHPFQWHFP